MIFSEYFRLFIFCYVSLATFCPQSWQSVIRDSEAIDKLEQLNMSLQEQARESMAKERQHDEHLHESMQSRAQAEIDNHVEGTTNEQARELTAQERQHENHVQESMLERSTEQIENS